jgi:hypothetical protein
MDQSVVVPVGSSLATLEKAVGVIERKPGSPGR